MLGLKRIFFPDGGRLLAGSAPISSELIQIVLQSDFYRMLKETGVCYRFAEVHNYRFNRAPDRYVDALLQFRTLDEELKMLLVMRDSVNFNPIIPTPNTATIHTGCGWENPGDLLPAVRAKRLKDGAR
jgi:hypothetical protein